MRLIARRTLIAALALMPLIFAPAVQAAEMGEDGLHKQPWFSLTFKDMAEDLAAANDAGKRLVIMFEQRGCIYCKKMHEEVFSDPDIAKFISDNFMVVQMNLFGNEEVTDFDGESLSEKEMARRWSVVFTPTILFMPEAAPDGPAGPAAVAVMPGAFGKGTTRNMFAWVLEKGYEGDEHFQKYHARKLSESK
ncbi:MAG: thioredoxin-related protein [Paracoccaceae bacterium]|jgi:thioredoxin-related protein